MNSFRAFKSAAIISAWSPVNIGVLASEATSALQALSLDSRWQTIPRPTKMLGISSSPKKTNPQNSPSSVDASEVYDKDERNRVSRTPIASGMLRMKRLSTFLTALAIKRELKIFDISPK
jgi:hypothetical protein